MSHDEEHIMSTSEKLVLHGQPDRRLLPLEAARGGIAGVAEHINKFWEPRMRRQLFEIVASGGAGLSPLVMEAVGKIRLPPPVEKPASAA